MASRGGRKAAALLAMVVGALGAPTTIAAQWRVGFDLTQGVARGNVTSILDTETERTVTARAVPINPTWYTARVERVWSRVAVAASVTVANPVVGVDAGEVLVGVGRTTLLELSPELGLRVARPGGSGSVWLWIGPTVSTWSGGLVSDRDVIGAQGAIALEWPLAGPLLFSARAALQVHPSIFTTRDIQPPNERLTAGWRRGISTGLRLRL